MILSSCSVTSCLQRKTANKKFSKKWPGHITPDSNLSSITIENEQSSRNITKINNVELAHWSRNILSIRGLLIEVGLLGIRLGYLLGTQTIQAHCTYQVISYVGWSAVELRSVRLLFFPCANSQIIPHERFICWEAGSLELLDHAEPLHDLKVWYCGNRR